MLLLAAAGPGTLKCPAQLFPDVVEEAPNTARPRCSLNPQQGVEHSALVAVAEPCVGGARDKKWDHNGDEQDSEVFPKEGPTQRNG